MDSKWFILRLNPEPWAVGDIFAGKTQTRIAPNPNLVAFQRAVKEALAEEERLPDKFRRLEFFFWREQAKYLDARDHIRQRNHADTTNCQKALEDALQGVLIENDREVVDIRSVMVQQGPDVEPMILIHATEIHKALHGIEDIPSKILEQAYAEPEEKPQADKWSEADELF